MVGQLAGAQAQVAGVVLTVDEGHTLAGKLLGKLGHQHLVAALVVTVRLFDVGEQGVANDLPQREAHNLSLHQQYAPQQVVGPIVVQNFVGLGDILMKGGGALAPAAGVLVQEGLNRRDILLDNGAEEPITVGF